MNDVKTLSFFSIFLAIIVVPFYCRAQWSFSVTGAGQLSREKITIGGTPLAVLTYTFRSKYVVLPKIGANFDYHISRLFNLRSGLILNGKGAKFTDPGSSSGPNDVLYHNTYFYLDIPLFLIVTPTLFSSRHLYGGAGFFIGYGLGGWYKVEDAHTHKVISKGRVKFRGKSGEGLKDLDNGINFLLGYKLCKHFSINFIYQYGLMDIYNGPDAAYSRSMSLGIDYKIK